MTETRKVAVILVADIVGYSRLAGADEERTIARLRALRSDLIDPTIALHNGRLGHCPKCQGAAARQWLEERRGPPAG